MLEILIVIVILAMAATLVAPAIDAGLRAREVRSATRTVAGTLRALQAEAIRTGKVQKLLVDPEGNVLQIESGRDVELADAARIAEIEGGELLPGAAVRVSFYPNGSNSGLSLVVAERGAPAREGFVVRLDPLIGLVTIGDPRA